VARKELLKKVLAHLGDALHDMERNADPDPGNAVIWDGLMAVHGTVEVELNQILMEEIREKAR